ncbi:MAG: DUF1549 domain-containing protein, partial [Planctomycetota bacterium]
MFLVVVLSVTAFAEADEVPETVASAEQLGFFEARIRPVLIQHCYSCHSAESEDVRGGLLLDTRAGLLRGGDSGPSIVPGQPSASPLLSALKHETVEMPPDQKLADSVIRDFEQWISDGAVDPRDGDSTVTRRTIDIEAGRGFWSFQPLTPVVVPSTRDSWARSDVDRFLIQQQQRILGSELVIAPDANADVILRRLSLILTGMLPSLDEQRQFAASFANNAEAAIATEIDRQLASPRYGERWGRHWLDVARYAESTGGGRSMMLPDAWRFRDYVIASFNGDKPFDQLIREHLAGDLLPSGSDAQHDEQVIGSGYLMLGAINYEEQDKEQ